jgi:Tol biopolymer transport system component
MKLNKAMNRLPNTIETGKKMKKQRGSILLVICSLVFISGCIQPSINGQTVPHEEKWGIYSLDLSTEEVNLIYSTPHEISTVRLNSDGNKFVFSQKIDSDDINHSEICTIGVNGEAFQRLTNNTYWDLYPTWSPDGTKIAFLSFRENDLDIYVMNTDGTNQQKLYDSGSHDADIHWVHHQIVFTSYSSIWLMNNDGTNPKKITDPPHAGQWGNANLPFGDYDPRLNPNGTTIVFERLEDDNSIHGNYNIFTIHSDGTRETRLTNTGYSQGLASWSHDGKKIIYIVASINDEGRYDIYLMNADGTGNHNITPGYFPADFLCHFAIFNTDDSSIYFIGEWWR